MRWVLPGLGALSLLYGAHLLALLAEARSLIFYRQRPPRVRSLGYLEALANPSIEYMIEEESSEAARADHADSGQADPHRYRDRHGSG
jgi:hypothetical protein